ncbi:MAG: primosomal protein N' [Gemmatimonadales bacterium]|nr:primosomal protein N' [Gemmatimonadales bacterium]
MTGLAAVALPLPLDALYTYRIPDALAPRLVPGARAVVPVRGRRVVGIVVATDVPDPGVALRDVLEAPDAVAALTPDLLETGRWMARYYGAPLGLALRALLPGPFWGHGGRAVTERWVALTEPRLGLLERDAAFRRAPRQREAYEALEAAGGAAPVTQLTVRHGVSPVALAALVRRGVAEEGTTPRERDPFAGLEAVPPPAHLTGAQQAAVERLAALPPGAEALLQGVTGSGKTAVYLELMRRVLAAGRGAILLVPEIGLTPQTVARVRGAFGAEVAVLHSGLSAGERADAWRALRDGSRRVAVGARSALFAPVRDLGLVILDEEHDASYKHGEAPRYHAREVAAVRARLAGATVVLGSATPSLETVARALPTARLAARVGERPMPPVELVDLRVAPLVREAHPVPWSDALDGEVGGALARGEQVLLLLNRRGFAAFVQCPGCGDVPACPHCSISLTPHRAPAGLRCHYCGHLEPPRDRCAACGGAVQVMRGVGTQQVEQVVAQRFPEARIARMDQDTTGTKWAHQRILGAMGRGEIDVLIGTQMVAKGLDFPDVTRVGVIDADVGLHLPDFRSAERTFQLLAQVAGRAGRGPLGGRVLVQTRTPGHHALVHAAAHDTDGFLRLERELRRSPPYPPAAQLVNLLVTGEDEVAVAERGTRLAAWCARAVERHALPVDVLGPAPCPLQRLQGRWRWHVVLRGPAAPLGRLVRALAGRTTGGEPRLAIDRDPMSLL